MLVTAQTICTRALRLLGQVGQGQTPNPNDLTDCLATFNEMLDGWKIDRLAVYTTQRVTQNLIANQSAYTIGIGGNFNVQRPSWVEYWSIIQTAAGPNALELPMPVLTVEEWQAVAVKTTQSALPTQAWYDYNYDTVNGLGTINFWPVPSVGNIAVALYIPTVLDVFPALSTQVNMAPGYVRALRFNLAEQYGLEAGVDIPPRVTALAAEYLGDIRRINTHPVKARVDKALTQYKSGYFNYYTGMPQ